MQIIPLYRYNRQSGGVTVSTEKPDGEYTECFRVVADIGMVLTDGKTFTFCIDTDDPSAWVEVEDPEAEATAADYQASLGEFGVKL